MVFVGCADFYEAYDYVNHLDFLFQKLLKLVYRKLRLLEAFFSEILVEDIDDHLFFYASVCSAFINYSLIKVAFFSLCVPFGRLYFMVSSVVVTYWPAFILIFYVFIFGF